MIDIAGLSATLKDIILDHDEVALPGIGMFLAEWVPASFADNGYSINPPDRKLTFIQRLGADTLLLDRFCKNADDKDAARAELLSFLMELNRKLKADKSIALPGLGLLRATDENLFFFVPEEHMDICPESFGLDKVYLKAAGAREDTAKPVAPSVEETPSEESQPIEDPQPVEEEVPSEEPQTLVAEPEASDEEPAVPEAVGIPEETPKRRIALKIFIALFVIAVLFFLALAILGRVAPDFIDKLLYSPEELEILKYRL